MTNKFEHAVLTEDQFNKLFADAHSQRTFEPEEPDVELIRRAYNLMKWAPTEFNISSLRLDLFTSEDARESVAQTMSPGNRAAVKAAPYLLVLSYDEAFENQLPKLGLGNQLIDSLTGNLEMAHDNAIMQAGYLILTLRALGLHLCPMSGANFEEMNDTVFSDSSRHPFLVLVAGTRPTDEGMRPRSGRVEDTDVITTH
ncbi:nitroreductase family protein [Gleimia hominis]|uniref:Nitroreductase family protein n=1 Tax=Gleimia hominis TaxID=595468 RepID=A0ABU3I9Z1_9ACTO|nr:nitroreductase family protein [Gleimia hominis]MDT3767185.1 nitroreductase family protein [Gleimia hominis]